MVNPPNNKRKVPPTAGPNPKRSKKLGARAKAGGAKANGKPKTSKPRAASAGRAVLDASALAWESVGEDFGGLQVLSGVEVVKDGEQVKFIVKGDAAEPTGAAAESGGEGETFEGFGDDGVEAPGLDPGAAGIPEADVAAEGAPDQAAASAAAKSRNDGKGRSGKTTRGEDQKVVQKAADAAGKKPKSRKVGDRGVAKTTSHGGGNEFAALAGMEEDGDGAGENDIDMAAWMALNLSPSLVSAIARLGFAKPTAIQRRSIPEIVAGADVIGKAQTGSGKTLAFGIPIVERWLEMHEGRMDVDVDDDEQEGLGKTMSTTTTKQEEEEEGKKKKKKKKKKKNQTPKAPLAFILSPTRELAKQIGDHIKAVCDGLPTSPYICVVTGGLSIQKQQRQLEKADIVIGTPGRLWEVLDGDAALQERFTRIRFLVIDEADRLFKDGQFKEAESIIGALDRQAPEEDGYGGGGDDDDDDRCDATTATRGRQTLVFSATFDKDLQTKLAGKARSSRSAGGVGGEDDKMAYLMKSLKFRGEPKYIDVNPVRRMADNLREGLIECGAMEKDLYLYTVLLLNPGRRTLVFTNSISAVRRVTPLLQNLGQNALPLHSQMIQKARLRSLEKFAASRSSVLVATDVAARGLDIKDVDQVIHYHVPRAADTYIHRSGRTARADKAGVSIMLCSPDEVLPTRRLAGKVHAQRSAAAGNTPAAAKHHMMESLPVDRKVASRLRPRLDLAKRITDATLAKEKAHSNDAWLRNAAEDLGVEYDPDEFEATEASGWGGAGSRGGGRRRKEKEVGALSKAEMAALRAQLRHELSQRVNLGVSERYITGGRVDIAQLLKERDTSLGGIFLGGTDTLSLGL